MIISLNGTDWQLKSDIVSDYIPATVPGVVQQALIDNRITTDFWYGNGPEDKYEACRHDWEYKKTFFMPICDDKMYTLVFKCVDFTCEVFLNGVSVGKNNGEYKLFRLDVTDALKLGAENELKVKIEKMPPELYDYLVISDGKNSGVDTEDMKYWFVNAMNLTRQRLNGLKSIATYSYDWSTNLYTLGIVKDVWLESSGDARIDWIKYIYDFSEGYKTADVTVIPEIYSDSALSDAKIEVSASINGKTVSETLTTDIAKGSGEYAVKLTIDAPELWWPVGYGDHPLYDVTVKILDNGNKLSDEKTERIGLRDIKWGQCDGLPEDFIHPLALYINGKRIRTFGSCFVTIDAFKGHEGIEKQEYFAELALRGNMNALRIHGGQSYYYDRFHDYCDENGLMLLMDMPIGNCVPEDLPGMYDMYRETFSNFIKQLRRHPCIIEWTGGNEMGWYSDPKMIHPALQVMLDAAHECDPQRIFRSTCPIVGTRHGHYDYNPDNHYEEYNAMRTDNCDNAPMQRNGEFACSTPSNIEIWNRYIASSDSTLPLDPDNPDLVRKNVFYSICPEMWLNLSMIERMAGKCDTLEKIIAAGQFFSGEGLRYAMDSFRSRGGSFSGFSTWCYNEPAPNGAGCGLVDFDGQPFHNYYMTKEAMDKISICAIFDSVFYNSGDSSYASLTVISDMPDTVRGLKWAWKLRDAAGRIYGAGGGFIDRIKPLECMKVDSIKINPPIKMKLGPVFLEMKLQKDEETVSERLQVFGMKGVMQPFGGLFNKNLPVKEFGIPYTMTGQTGGGVAQTDLNVTLESDGKRKLICRIENTGEQIALYCKVNTLTKYVPRLFYDRNFISVPPHESRVIHIESPYEDIDCVGVSVEGFNTPVYKVVSPKTPAYMSRTDGTCRGYSYESGEKQIEAKNGIFDSSKVKYICDDEIEFSFDAKNEEVCKAEISVSDVCKSGVTVCAELNGVKTELIFAPGRGLKACDPDALADCETRCAVFENALREGKNMLKLKLNGGWFAWDALNITIIEKE